MFKLNEYPGEPDQMFVNIDLINLYPSPWAWRGFKVPKNYVKNNLNEKGLIILKQGGSEGGWRGEEDGG